MRIDGRLFWSVGLACWAMVLAFGAFGDFAPGTVLFAALLGTLAWLLYHRVVVLWLASPAVLLIPGWLLSLGAGSVPVPPESLWSLVVSYLYSAMLMTVWIGPAIIVRIALTSPDGVPRFRRSHD